MSTLFEKNKSLTSKYVHATSKGHEAFQIALGQQLKSYDYVFPYYRDDALLLAMGFSPKQLMLQLLAKKTTLFQEVEPIMLTLVLNTMIFQRFLISLQQQECKLYRQRVQPWA